MLIGYNNKLFHCCFSDAPCRDVDDPQKRFIILMIDHQPVISQYILYFLSLVERQTSINAARDVESSQCFLMCAGLGVRAVQDSKGRIRKLVVHLMLEDRLSNKITFL